MAISTWMHLEKREGIGTGRERKTEGKKGMKCPRPSLSSLHSTLASNPLSSFLLATEFSLFNDKTSNLDNQYRTSKVIRRLRGREKGALMRPEKEREERRRLVNGEDEISSGEKRGQLSSRLETMDR